VTKLHDKFCFSASWTEAKMFSISPFYEHISGFCLQAFSCDHHQFIGGVLNGLLRERKGLEKVDLLKVRQNHQTSLPIQNQQC